MTAPARLAPEPAPAQYRVLRSLKLSADHTAQPGELVTPDDAWPYHRAGDLVRQRYLEPIAPSRKDKTHA